MKSTRFKLHKTFTLVGTTGHAIAFTKGELTHVPKEMHADALAIGAVPEHELQEDVVRHAPVLSADERKELIFAAYTTLVEKNAREAFTGNGSPHIKAVAEITGFAVDAKERDATWTEFRQLTSDPDA
jgi:hypothetical protein